VLSLSKIPLPFPASVLVSNSLQLLNISLSLPPMISVLVSNSLELLNLCPYVSTLGNCMNGPVGRANMNVKPPVAVGHDTMICSSNLTLVPNCRL
jgi:hypothetical protein